MHHEVITIVNIYVLNVNAPNFIKQTQLELKVQIDSYTKIVEYFNTLLSPIDRSSRQKANKKPSELNDIINQMNLPDICRVFHPEAA
jgi:hypothetical protein